MFDDDLENPSPDDSGAKESEPGKRGPEGGRGPLVTRRNFLAACLAGASAMLLWPRAAKADGYDVGAGWFGSAGNGATLKHGDGNWIGSKSGWFDWVCGYSERIGVAMGLWVDVSWTNELYDIFHMQPLSACRDWNDQSGKRLWYPWDKDTRLRYWTDGAMVYEDHGWALTNQGCGSGYGGWYETGLLSFGYPGLYFDHRRKASRRSHGFGLEAGYYNVSVGLNAGGRWNDWDSIYLWIATSGGYSCADWSYQGAAFDPGGTCPGDITAGQNRCHLANRWDLFGGVFAVRTMLDPSRSQCLDVCGGSTENNCDVWSWTYYGSTSQNWLVSAGDVDSNGAGHLHSLQAAHQPVMALHEYGGAAGPQGKATYNDAHCNGKVHPMVSNCTYEGASEFQFWVGGQYNAWTGGETVVTCDASGRRLDYSGGADNLGERNPIQFYCGGYDGEWSNMAGAWDFEEVRFKETRPLPAPEMSEGKGVCPDPAALDASGEPCCKPWDCAGTGKTPYIYRWYGADREEDLSIEDDGAYVMARYMRSAWGEVGDGSYGAPEGVPAHRHIGLPHELWSDGIAVGDVQMWVENCKWPGEIHCRLLATSSDYEHSNFVHNGLEPRYTGSSDSSSDAFRRSGGCGSAANADFDEPAPCGASRGIRITGDGTGEIGVAQDGRTLGAGCAYVMSAWVKGSRAGIPCAIEAFWRGSDDPGYLHFETTGEWQRVTQTATASTTGGYSGPYAFIEGGKEGDTLDVCGFELARADASGGFAEASWGEAVGSSIACPGNIVKRGLEPRFSESSSFGSWDGTFRKSMDGGSVSDVDFPSPAPCGAARGIRIAYSTGEIGIAQDRTPLSAGTGYVGSAWVKGSRAGMKCAFQAFWTNSDNPGLAFFETTGEWQRVSQAATAKESSPHSAGYVYIESASAGDTLDVCGVRLDEAGVEGAWPSATWSRGGAAGTATKAELWLSGEISEHYDLDCRCYTQGGRWSGHSFSHGEDVHATIGDGTAIGCMQVHLVPKPPAAALLSDLGAPGADERSAGLEGVEAQYVACLVRLGIACPDAAERASRGCDYADWDWMCDRYQGAALTEPAENVFAGARFLFYVDGEDEPCHKAGPFRGIPTDEDRARMLEAANSAAQKEGCLPFGDGMAPWFTDEAMAVPASAEDFAAKKGTVKLYGANRCSLEYATTTRSCVLDASYAWKADEAMARDLDLAALYPATSVVRYGESVTFAGPWSAWCLDMGKARKVASTPGVYAARAATGSPVASAKLMRNSVVYVDWPWAGYDGVASAW